MLQRHLISMKSKRLSFKNKMVLYFINIFNLFISSIYQSNWKSRQLTWHKLIEKLTLNFQTRYISVITTNICSGIQETSQETDYQKEFKNSAKFLWCTTGGQTSFCGEFFRENPRIIARVIINTLLTREKSLKTMLTY